MKLPLGLDNFKELILQQYFFVDKSLFIKEVLEETAETCLITRPRRFGKTINMSMLRYFFSNIDAKNNRALFKNCLIAKEQLADGKACIDFQGKFPVVFLTFKAIKEPSYQAACQAIAALISKVYQEHRYLLTSKVLHEEEKHRYQQIITETADIVHLKTSLRNLIEYLYRYYKVKPIVLIDEYDTPMHASFSAREHYYEDMLNFMGGFLNNAFKGNEFLHKGILTGILRVSLVNLFSGANNIPVRNILSDKYAEYFGFTTDEVNDLLAKTNLQNQAEAIKDWYNGYQIGGITLYNPWSIVNCLDEKGKLQPYWLETGENSLIGHALKNKRISVKLKLQQLITGATVEVTIDQRTIFADLERNSEVVWGLLAYAGYLNILQSEVREDTLISAQAKIPNREVLGVYLRFVREWYEEALGLEDYQAFLESLVNGNIAEFQERLKSYLDESISYFDLGKKTPEKVYHVFVLGLMIGLRTNYIIKSNQEAGSGRFDVMLLPKNKSAQGIIMEFKSIDDNKKLAATAKAALQQIIKHNYQSELQQHGVNNILNIGVAFSGQQVYCATTQI